MEFTHKPMQTATGRMRELARGLSTEERAVLKSMLSTKIPIFFDHQNRLAFTDQASAEQFHSLAEMLREISFPNDEIPGNGIAFRGTPNWVTPELLQRLRVEARQRRHAPLDRVDHYLGCGGKEADQLSVSRQVVEFVTAHVGSVTPTGIASYLYYDQPGLGIRPHVDTDVFSINLMLMLQHKHPDHAHPSATLVFPAWGEPERYYLLPGEVMIMYGGSVIHTRSIVGLGEDIHLLTMGFNSAIAVAR